MSHFCPRAIKKHVEELCILVANPHDFTAQEALDYFKDLYDNTEDILPGFASECATQTFRQFSRNKEISGNIFRKAGAFRINALRYKINAKLS